MWKFKGSPVGRASGADRCGTGVARASRNPVRTLVIRDLKSKTGYGVNLHELGPSYASAYGLVAAYHSRSRRARTARSSSWRRRIRTHGSVDYMSIMQRHSHGVTACTTTSPSV